MTGKEAKFGFAAAYPALKATKQKGSLQHGTLVGSGVVG